MSFRPGFQYSHLTPPHPTVPHFTPLLGRSASQLCTPLPDGPFPCASSPLLALTLARKSPFHLALPRAHEPAPLIIHILSSTARAQLCVDASVCSFDAQRSMFRSRARRLGAEGSALRLSVQHARRPTSDVQRRPNATHDVDHALFNVYGSSAQRTSGACAQGTSH